MQPLLLSCCPSSPSDRVALHWHSLSLPPSVSLSAPCRERLRQAAAAVQVRAPLQLQQYLIVHPAPPLTRWRRRSARQQHSIVQRSAQEQSGRRMRTVRCARCVSSVRCLAPQRDVAPQKPLLRALNKGSPPQQQPVLDVDPLFKQPRRGSGAAPSRVGRAMSWETLVTWPL